jgi:hypothetical protein
MAVEGSGLATSIHPDQAYIEQVATVARNVQI